MKRYAVNAALLGFTALFTGCGPEKVLPTVAPKADSPPVQLVVPAKSDPEAKVTTDHAVRAFTGGKPELLAKSKACRLSLKGHMYLGNPNQPDETIRTLTMVWPDRLHFINEGESLGNKLVVESWLRRPEVFVRGNGVDRRPANPADYEQNLANDLMGQIWMTLMLPATDPKAVVFDPQTITLDHRSLKLVKLALGEYPVYQLYFDAKTGALVRVEYTNTEAGVPRLTTLVASEHKTGPEGLLLPYKLECLHNKNVVEKWTVEKWEFPAEIKDDEFSPKKK